MTSLPDRVRAVRDRIALINTDVDKTSAQKDGPDLMWACKELREIADLLEAVDRYEE